MSKTLPPRCKLTELGTLHGIPVLAVTDDAGPNVIIGGQNYLLHLLSPNYKSHERAIENGKKIIKAQRLPVNYTNMKDEHAGMSRSFMNIFFNARRGRHL